MTSTERRVTPRLRLPLDVAVDGAPAQLMDVSPGGVSLRGAGFGPAGTTVELTLPLPDRAPPLVARGEVVHASIAATGLRLVALTPDERERLDRFAFAARRLLAA
jgi:hypothetical protein